MNESLVLLLRRQLCNVAKTYMLVSVNTTRQISHTVSSSHRSRSRSGSLAVAAQRVPTSVYRGLLSPGLPCPLPIDQLPLCSVPASDSHADFDCCAGNSYYETASEAAMAGYRFEVGAALSMIMVDCLNLRNRQQLGGRSRVVDT